jgi:hypothetical protein
MKFSHLIHQEKNTKKKRNKKEKKTPEGPAINDKLGFLSNANATEDI